MRSLTYHYGGDNICPVLLYLRAPFRSHILRCSGCEPELVGPLGYFDHGTIDGHLDDVQSVVLTSSVVVEPHLPGKSLDFDLKRSQANSFLAIVKREKKISKLVDKIEKLWRRANFEILSKSIWGFRKQISSRVSRVSPQVMLIELFNRLRFTVGKRRGLIWNGRKSVKIWRQQRKKSLYIIRWTGMMNVFPDWTASHLTRLLSVHLQFFTIVTRMMKLNLFFHSHVLFFWLWKSSRSSLCIAFRINPPLH